MNNRGKGWAGEVSAEHKRGGVSRGWGVDVTLFRSRTSRRPDYRPPE